jgi:hypothetical protein
MKHYLLILSAVIISLATAPICYADPISPSKSKEIANRFCASKHWGTKVGQMTNTIATRSSSENQPYYIYNTADDHGFVIVAGDDNMPAILGYSDESSFTGEGIPEALQDLLDSYKARYEIAKTETKTSATLASGEPDTTDTSVAPLIKTTWGQGAPYYNMCPIYFNGKRCYTGCVATAMAQVLYYFYCTQPSKMPDALNKAIPSYDYKTTWNKQQETVHVDGIPATDKINWKDMTESYNSSSTAAAKDAVAKLMIMCAASIKSDFYQGSTSACVLASAFKNADGKPITPGANDALNRYFSLSNKYKYKYFLSDNNTVLGMIKESLGRKSPVILSGQDKTKKSGHAFVVDGINGKDDVHINWGWDGRYNVTIQFRPSCNQTKNPEVILGIFCIGMAEVA